VFLEKGVQGQTGPTLPGKNTTASSGELLGGPYQGDGAEALTGLFMPTSRDRADRPLLLHSNDGLNTKNDRPETAEDGALGIIITYPSNDEVLPFGTVALTYETRGFTVEENTPIEVFVPQNGEIPFFLTETTDIIMSSPWPCTQLVTLAATVRGQRLSTSVLFSTIPEKAAILSARATLPADAVWGLRSGADISRQREPEEDQIIGRNGDKGEKGPLGTEGLDRRVGTSQQAEFAVETRGARPISLVFVGSMAFDGQKYIWLEQMERLSRARFTPKFLTFQTMHGVGDKSNGSIYADAVGASDWEKNAAHTLTQRLSRAGVQLITAQVPPVDMSRVSDGSGGQSSIRSLKEKASRMLLDSFDRAAGDPHLMTPQWTRDTFQHIADAIKYASPGVLVFANGNNLQDVVLTKAARWAMGANGCKIVMDFPNLGPELSVDVDLLVTPSHFVSRHPDTEALATATGAAVVVIPPGIQRVSSDVFPVYPPAAGGMPLRKASGELIHELACADSIPGRKDCCHTACHVVGFAGRLAPEKNPGLFMVVAQALAALVPSVVFVVVGDGPLRPELEATAARLGIASRVYFAGWANGAHFQRLLEGMTLLLNPGMSETFCIINIQAMSLGTPVAAFGIGGMLEYGNLALLDDAEPGRVAAAVAELLLDRPRLDALAERGRAEVLKNFQADVAVERWALLYETLVGWEPGDV
ncbi:unnamed protein product, partial [Hapterophycus canaliculatus]